MYGGFLVMELNPIIIGIAGGTGSGAWLCILYQHADRSPAGYESAVCDCVYHLHRGKSGGSREYGNQTSGTGDGNHQ